MIQRSNHRHRLELVVAGEHHHKANHVPEQGRDGGEQF